MTSSTYSKGGTKLLKGGTKLLKGGTKLLKGGTKLLKGGTKLLKGGTKLLKGGTKLLKGGTKSLGWATGGGRTTPPTPPPPLATGLYVYYSPICLSSQYYRFTLKKALNTFTKKSLFPLLEFRRNSKLLEESSLLVIHSVILDTELRLRSLGNVLVLASRLGSDSSEELGFDILTSGGVDAKLSLPRLLHGIMTGALGTSLVW